MANEPIEASANSRAIAVRALSKILMRRASLDILLSDKNISDAMRPGLFELVYGVLRHFYALEYALQKHMRSKLRAKDTDIYCVLLIGAYQLKHMRTPAYAAVNECVALSKKLGKPWAKGLVNAILRNIARETERSQPADSLDAPVQADSPTQEAIHNHPAWMIDRFRLAYPDSWPEIIEVNNSRAPLNLRVNLSKITREDYQKQLSQAQISSQAGGPRAAIRLDQATSMQSLPGWSSGLCSVQDEAPQHLSHFIKFAAGTRILDACAAPGGKSLLIMEQSPGAVLTALDMDEKRLSRLAEESVRLGLTPPKTLAGDATQLDWWDQHHYDFIVLDAPCSGSGTIRRHPDIKLLKLPEDLCKYQQLQLQLLNNLWATLRDQGALLYATCSIFPEENDAVIQQFINETPDAKHQATELDVGFDTVLGHQLLPKKGGHDGFYFSLLSKNST